MGVGVKKRISEKMIWFMGFRKELEILLGLADG